MPARGSALPPWGNWSYPKIFAPYQDMIDPLSLHMLCFVAGGAFSLFSRGGGEAIFFLVRTAAGFIKFSEL